MSHIDKFDFFLLIIRRINIDILLFLNKFIKKNHSEIRKIKKTTKKLKKSKFKKYVYNIKL